MKKVMSIIAPFGSKRRVILKLIRNGLRNPKEYLKKLNLENIKKFTKSLKSEDIKKLEAKLDLFDEKGKEIKGKSLEIFEDKEIFEKIIFEKFDNPKVSIIIPVYN